MIERLGEIAARHELDLIVQFGSTVTGTTHARSDLDLAVRFRIPEVDWNRGASVVSDLQELFSGRDVDLSLINRADPLHLEKICESGLLLVGDPRAWEELKIYAWRRYQDHRRFFEMESEYVDRWLAGERGGRRLDTVLVKKKLAMIVEDLEALSAEGALEPGSWQADSARQAAIERYLERLIGRMIDVNYHLVAVSGAAPPKDYFASFIATGRIGVLDAHLATRIAAAAGLRNRIAHDYDAIDPTKLAEGARALLDDLPSWIESVRAHLLR